MTVEFVAAAAGTSASAGAVVTVPEEIEAGDLLVAVVATNSTSGYSQVTPTGWSLLTTSHGSNDGGTQFASIYQRRASATDAGSQLLVEVLPANPKSTIVVAAYRATDGDPVVSGSAVLPHTGANTTTVDSPHLEVDELPTLLIAAASKKGGTEAIEMTAPDGFEPRAIDTADGGGAIACALADTAADATGETNVGPWDTSVSSGAGAGFLLAVREEIEEPPPPPAFPRARLAVVVELAPGADIINDDETAWPWTQIPAGDIDAQSISIKRGRADETGQAQPATVNLTLANLHGHYTPGNPASPHYPGLGRGTPIRISVDHDGQRHTRFAGHVDAWLPRWPHGDLSTESHPGEAVVDITAASLLRRMSQGVKPLRSALTRELAGPYRAATAAAYWPCEDGRAASSISSALEGGRSMDILGNPDMSSYGDFLASEPLPTMRDGAFIGPVGEYSDTGEHFFRAFVHIPDGTQIAAGTTLFRLTCTGGTMQTWRIRYGDGGALGITVQDASANVVFEQLNINFGILDAQLSLALTMRQTDTDTIEWQLLCFFLRPDGTTDNLAYSDEFSGRIGRVSQVEVAPFRNALDLAVGHVAFSSDDSYFANTDGPFTAWRGERAGERMRRLATEESLRLTVDGEPEYEQLVGPQLPETLLDLVHEAANTDGGYLADSLQHFGIDYRNPGSLYSQTPALVLDAAQSQIAAPFEPVLDDQRIRNDVTVSTVTGESARYAIQQPELGRYDEQAEVNANHWTQLENMAAWRVALGTWPAMRYPTVTTELAIVPSELIDRWLALRLGDRVQVTGLPPQHPNATVDLIAEGYTETITPTRWTVELACSPAGPWIVGTVGDEQLSRLSPDNTVLTAGVDETATEIPIIIITTTTGGPAWTIDPDDWPLDIDIGGETMRVVEITDTENDGEQVLIVERGTTGDSHVHEAGTPVRLVRPLTLGI